jgi:hypothetical protein
MFVPRDDSRLIGLEETYRVVGSSSALIDPSDEPIGNLNAYALHELLASLLGGVVGEDAKALKREWRTIDKD